MSPSAEEIRDGAEEEVAKPEDGLHSTALPLAAQVRRKDPKIAWSLVRYEGLQDLTVQADPNVSFLIDLAAMQAKLLRQSADTVSNNSQLTHKLTDVVAWLYLSRDNLFEDATQEQQTEPNRQTVQTEFGEPKPQQKKPKKKQKSQKKKKGDAKGTGRIRRLQKALNREKRGFFNNPVALAKKLNKFIILNETLIAFPDIGGVLFKELKKIDSDLYPMFRAALHIAVENHWDLDSMTGIDDLSRKAYILDRVLADDEEYEAVLYIYNISDVIDPNIASAIENEQGGVDRRKVRELVVQYPNDSILARLDRSLNYPFGVVINTPPRWVNRIYSKSKQDEWERAYSLEDGILTEMNTAKLEQDYKNIQTFTLSSTLGTLEMQFMRRFVPAGIELQAVPLPDGRFVVLWFVRNPAEDKIKTDEDMLLAEASWNILNEEGWLNGEAPIQSFAALDQVASMIREQNPSKERNHNVVRQGVRQALTVFDVWIDPPQVISVDENIRQYGITNISISRTEDRMISGKMTWSGFTFPFKIHDDGTVLLPAGLSEYAFFAIEHLITMHLAKYQEGYVEANYQYVKDVRAEGRGARLDIEDVDRLLRMTMTLERAEAMEAKNRELLPLALGGVRSINDAVTFIETARYSEEYRAGIEGISYSMRDAQVVTGYADILGTKLKFAIDRRNGIRLDTPILSEASRINLESVIIHYLSEFRSGDGVFADYAGESLATKDRVPEMPERDQNDVARITHLRSLKLGQVPHESVDPQMGMTLNDLAKQHFGYELDKINTELVNVMHDISHQAKLEEEDPVLAVIVAVMLSRVVGKSYRDLAFLQHEQTSSTVNSTDYHLAVSAGREGPVADHKQSSEAYKQAFVDYLKQNLGFSDDFIADYMQKGCPQALVTLIPAVGQISKRVIKGIPPRPEVEPISWY